MDVRVSASEWGQALNLSRCILALAAEDVEASLRLEATRAWGNPTSISIYPRGGNFPSWALVTYRDDVIVVSEGVKTAGQAATLASGYTNPQAVEDSSWQVNPRLASWVTTQIMPAVRAGLVGRGGLLLGGHSMGGAGLQLAQALIASTVRLDFISCVTCGSPMVGNRAMADELDLFTSRRLQMQYDPIPCTWPSFVQGPLINVLVGPRSSNNGLGFRHNLQGVVLLADSQSVVQYQPDLIHPIAEADLTSLLVRTIRDEISEHAIESYVQWLTLKVASEPVRERQRPAPPQEFAVIPADEAITRAELRRAVDFALADRERFQIRGRVVVPNKIIFFVAKKYGERWGVKFGDVWISYGMKRRRATHMAFIGNLFLKEYLRVGVAYPETFTTQMEGWFAAAENPASGIRPVLNSNPLTLR